jgi:putative Ca2+/H+ antiporter (TMEM165/GDT1 family)
MTMPHEEHSRSRPDPAPELPDGGEPPASSLQVDPQRVTADEGGGGSWWAIFLATTSTVFLAELGDKTQLAALLLSAESGEPVVVFLGTSLALISSSLVGVLLGRWLSSLMPPQQLERAAGIVMVAVGLWLGRQAVLQLIPVDSAIG